MSLLEPAGPRWTARNLPRRAFDATARRKAELHHAVRVSAAVAAAFAVSALIHLPQGYWAVFTAVIVVQTSIGATITASMERLLGTVVGGLVGVAGAYLRASTVLEEGVVLSLAVALLAFAAAVQPRLRVAPITAAIVLVGGSSAHMSPILAASWRVADILLGSVIGLSATLFIFPARARRAVMQRVCRTAGVLAGLLDLYARALAEGELGAGVSQAHQAARKQLAGVEQAIAEAARENASGLGEAQVSDALLRTLLRVRADTVMVGRALASPLPPAVAAVLAAPSGALLSEVAEQLRLCADPVEGQIRPSAEPLARPRVMFEQAVEGAREARLTAAMTFEEAARVFGLVFALESLMADIADLIDRIAELQAPPVAAAAAPVAP